MHQCSYVKYVDICTYFNICLYTYILHTYCICLITWYVSSHMLMRVYVVHAGMLVFAATLACRLMFVCLFVCKV